MELLAFLAFTAILILGAFAFAFTVTRPKGTQIPLVFVASASGQAELTVLIQALRAANVKSHIRNVRLEPVQTLRHAPRPPALSRTSGELYRVRKPAPETSGAGYHGHRTV